MRELALFAGAGGSILAGRLLGWQTVCAVENDPYCQAVLLARQADGILERFPIWDDVRTFDGTQWRDRVDVVTAGFPCQPFSVAGKRRGADDDRNLWPDTVRIIREVGPRFVFLENVPGLLVHEYAATIFGQLAESGYDCRWDCLSAAAESAHHFRYRLYVVAARSDAIGWRPQRQRTAAQGSWPRERFESLVQAELRISVPSGSSGGISTRMARRMDRLKALGNGWVPAVAARAWRLLTSADSGGKIDVRRGQGLV